MRSTRRIIVVSCALTLLYGSLSASTCTTAQDMVSYREELRSGKVFTAEPVPVMITNEYAEWVPVSEVALLQPDMLASIPALQVVDAPIPVTASMAAYGHAIRLCTGATSVDYTNKSEEDHVPLHIDPGLLS